MREVANETVRTLHKMLIDKNKSITNKEQEIDELRDQLEKQNESHTTQLLKINRDQSIMGKDTMKNLNNIVSKNKQSEIQDFKPTQSLHDVSKNSDLELKQMQTQL